MSDEIESFDISSDVLVPVTRLVAGDRLNLKGSPLLEKCTCTVCAHAKKQADSGQEFVVLGLGQIEDHPDEVLIETDVWGTLVPFSTRFPVSRFVEEGLA